MAKRQISTLAEPCCGSMLQEPLAERDAIEPLGTEVSAGGMPGRVKCLHVHVAHALAAGVAVQRLGVPAP